MGGGAGMKPVQDDGRDLSATDLRNAIEAGNVDVLSKFLPDNLKKDARAILKKLKPSELASEMIDRMISEQMNEMSAMGAGAVAGHAGPSKKSKKKKKKRIFREEDDNYNEIEKITNMVIEKLKGKIDNAD